MTVKRVAGTVLPALSVVALLSVAVHAATAVWPSGIGDMLSYWHAAESLRSGGSGVYDPSRLPEGVWPFLYPPAFLGGFAVLGLVPPSVAFLLWALFVASTVLLAFLALRALGGLGPWRVTLLGLALALPTFQLLVMGQVDALVVALLALALLAERTDRPRTAGVLIGVGAVIKVVPALALLPFLVLRRWAVAGSAVLAAGLLSLLPLVWLVPDLGIVGGLGRLVGLHVEFADRVLVRGLSQRPAEEWMLLPTNASLPGSALRLVGAPGLGTLTMWLLVGAATWIAYRAKDVGLGVALVVTGAALGNFVFWPHSAFLFGLPLAVAFSVAGSVLLVAAFAAVTWLSPVLGTLGYLGVWGVCTARRSTRVDRGTVPPTDG